MIVKNDRFGRRVDRVDFHPAYHALMALNVKNGVTAYAWNNADKPKAQVGCFLSFSVDLMRLAI